MKKLINLIPAYLNLLLDGYRPQWSFFLSV